MFCILDSRILGRMNFERPLITCTIVGALLGVTNCIVRNSEISDTGAVNAIVSCQRASLLSRLIER